MTVKVYRDTLDNELEWKETRNIIGKHSNTAKDRNRDKLYTKTDSATRHRKTKIDMEIRSVIKGDDKYWDEDRYRDKDRCIVTDTCIVNSYLQI